MMEDILCDVCFTNLESGEEFDFCDECEDMVDRYCFLCDTVREESVATICDTCMDEMDEAYNNPSMMRGGCIVTDPSLTKDWEYPEL